MITASATRLDGNQPVPEALRGAIIALGNFDGFHAGHQAVAGEAIKWAKAEGRPAIIATFDPHPVRFFKPDTPPFRLTTLDQRERLFLEAGADAMLVFSFGKELASTTAEDFITELLIARFGAAGVVTGEDFSFGKGAKGNITILREHGAGHGLQARAVSPVEDGEIISSSRIREALQAGDPQEAARLMTRPFAIQAEVQHGDKNGRKLGYPTANLDMGHYLRPKYGVYAITGALPDGRVLQGAANLGIRPQFDPPKELLEPHFFDFNEDLYGQTIEVALHHFLRPEAKFDDLDALMAQMAKDCDKARELLASAAIRA
ncbi:bifunctional riboflavin kinase/FAD synthetase [Alterisphingorhabdus coralli]|uniref:Riboflavin biosynthesis protein n=1 Tax=Alterisphingorhabdus coralli TaxID=3071408 RepID=A0AA97F7V4_9SPHN|nr:bifunctional riboflavin kinase/FAD synthetase [Parasphingorhabdus sp. SCSIO 66989]WOE75598.1 bifunctional riboflavin kinase/FAD synthetase [Parasphingorhabdus sp. SCSIO 66989]